METTTVFPGQPGDLVVERLVVTATPDRELRAKETLEEMATTQERLAVAVVVMDPLEARESIAAVGWVETEGPDTFTPEPIMVLEEAQAQLGQPASEEIIQPRPEQPVLGMVVTTMVSPRMQLPTLDPVVEVAAVTQEAKQT